MLLKILGIGLVILVVITCGCGLAIHYKWVGEMKPTPHIVLGAMVLLTAIAVSVAAITSK